MTKLEYMIDTIKKKGKYITGSFGFRKNKFGLSADSAFAQQIIFGLYKNLSDDEKSTVKKGATRLTSIGFWDFLDQKLENPSKDSKPTVNASNLIDKLQSETKELKQKFLNMTKEWATSNFERVEKTFNWKEIDWCKYLKIEPSADNTFPRGFYNTSKAKTYEKLKREIDGIRRFGKSGYVSNALKDAEIHYEESIKKLATRIEEKGLDIENLKLSSSNVGVNFETKITDGVKTVRAFTIIASGLVQRPHYRYLVK